MSGFASLLSASLRIASLDLCADEYLLMFAEPDQVTSVSFLSRDRQESELASAARQYPGNDGSIESVLPHRPDILLTTRPVGGARAEIAQRLGIRVVALPYASSPEVVARNVRRVAAITGKEDKAIEWQQRFKALRSGSAPDGLSVIWLGPGGLEVGDAGRKWLTYAGMVPAPLKSGLGTVEQVASANADLLLVSNYRAGEFSRGREWLDHPIIRQQARPKLKVDGRPWTCAGPLMLDQIERLRQR